MNNRETIKEVIIATMQEVAVDQGISLGALADDTLLLESGLDSLSFAICVAELENRLGYDPFVLMEDPVYPRILKEFVDVYERFAHKRL